MVPRLRVLLRVRSYFPDCAVVTAGAADMATDLLQHASRQPWAKRYWPSYYREAEAPG